MKKLLLIIPLLFGCAREYRCDAGPPCEPPNVETGDNINYQLGTICDAIITVEWPDGEKEAEEICEEGFTINGEMANYTCKCEKAD